jgi:hypothetical protein
MAIEETLREDQEHQVLAGADLDPALQSPDTVVQSEAPTKAETRTEADLETDHVLPDSD